jgi:hypothetical protein
MRDAFEVISGAESVTVQTGSGHGGVVLTPAVPEHADERLASARVDDPGYRQQFGGWPGFRPPRGGSRSRSCSHSDVPFLRGDYRHAKGSGDGARTEIAAQQLARK